MRTGRQAAADQTARPQARSAVNESRSIAACEPWFSRVAVSESPDGSSPVAADAGISPRV